MTRSMREGEPNIRILGRYELHGELATGGMATVHLGRVCGEVGFSRPVAIKRLHDRYAKDPDFVAMFVDEARLAARIQHPNVVTTLDVVATGGELFLVMEYVQGESVARLLRLLATKTARMPPPVVLAVAVDLLDGLHAAHEAKSERGTPLDLVHRDVSPQNVIVGSDGVARVFDFGVAKAVHRISSTHDGSLKGKIAYMAPEQLMNTAVDRRADIWASGIVLWEMLVGRRLFAGDSHASLTHRALNEPIPPPSSFGTPPALDAVVARALSRDASARFATARDMARALERVLAPASRRDVAEWLEAVAGDMLRDRAARIADVERHASDGRPSGATRVEIAGLVAGGTGPQRERPQSEPARAPDPLSATVEAAVSAKPHVMGRYVVYRELASGGMASVWLARQRGDGGFARIVAVKRPFPQYARDPEFVSMFRDEARLAARVRHPNVVPTLDVIDVEGELLLVMEYVAGESLSKLLASAARRNEPVDPAVAVSIMTGVLEGLHAAHQATNERGVPLNIVHRDVSPQNVLVGSDGVPRVVDFGVAKALGRHQQTTQTGQLKGKLLYMPPEQVSGKEVDRRSDLWAAAGILWEMLAGRPLFPDAPDALRYHAGRDEIAMPQEAPESLHAVLRRGLARDPDERYATARDMIVALERAVQPAPVRRVGQWVQKLARDALRERARYVEELEAHVARESNKAQPNASSEPPPAPEAVVTATMLTPPPRASAPPPTSELSASSTIETTAPVPTRRWRPLVVLSLGILVLAGAVMTQAVLARRRAQASDATTTAPPTTTTSAEPAPTGAPAVSVPAPSSSAVAASSTTPSPSSSPSRSTAPPKPNVKRGPVGPRVTKPATPSTPTSTSTSRPNPDPLEHDSRK